jgi:hypothetical protein
MRVVRLAFREFRFNWHRNAIFGSILFVSICVQLFTAMSAAASKIAVETYGAAVFGHAETYQATLDGTLTVDQLRMFNEQLEVVGRSHPWFRPATVVDMQGYVRILPTDDYAVASPLTLRAVTRSWQLLTPAIADDDIWRTVTSDQRMGVAMMLESATAQRLRIMQPQAVTVLVDPARADGSSSTPPGGVPGDEAVSGPGEGGTVTTAPQHDAGGSRVALASVPVFGTYQELNKALVADALVNQNVLSLVRAGPQTVQVYWRCDRAVCRDIYGLLTTAAEAVGTKPGNARRVDQIDQLEPVLLQQERDGQRFAVVVLVLGALAVAIVSTAFVEVRAPQFTTLRALGATRSAIGMIALLESLFTAVFIGLLAVALGAVAGFMDPNLFNQIPQVVLEHMPVPVLLYGQTVALTLGVGLVAGLAPAIRAYRSVRTS